MNGWEVPDYLAIASFSYLHPPSGVSVIYIYIYIYIYMCVCVCVCDQPRGLVVRVSDY